MKHHWVRTLFIRAVSRRWSQPFFRMLHLLSLGGMSIGTGSEVVSSGEIHALSQLRALSPAPDPLIIFDIGANVGEFARAALQIGSGRFMIYCFEPAAGAFNILRKNVVNQQMIKLHNFVTALPSEVFGD